MKKRTFELAAWVAALAILSALLVQEGRRRVALERRIPVQAREVYRTLARSQTAWQVIDVRPDLADGYEDAHVPGAIPVPGCDLDRAPVAARDRVFPSVPTIVVGDGGGAGLAACLARFGAARPLAGGMAAWSAARLPEDSGPYSPPSVKAGGGCL
ncbi:MAG TPA: rhodanese-like domain-containing protein [Anaeromyxobacter sp.]